MDADTVYFFRTDINTNVASIGQYRSLASDALTRMTFDLPDSVRDPGHRRTAG